MLTIKKEGHIIIQAKSTDLFKPDYETEKEKPNTLYVTTTEKERGLIDG